MRGLNYNETIAGQSPDNVAHQKFALASSLVDQVILPNFLISLEQFQNLNLPPMNNFRVQQGTEEEIRRRGNYEGKMSARNLLLNEKIDRKFCLLIVVLIVFVALLIAAVAILVVFKLTNKI